MIEIRKATIEDLELVKKLNHEIMFKNSDFDKHIDIDFDLKDVGTEFFKEDINNPDGLFYLAFDGEKCIGYINGSKMEQKYRRGKGFEISNLGVIPDYYRKGVGKMLYEYLLKIVKEAGYTRITLNCYSKNDGAIAFYRGLEFEEIDISFEKEI